MMLDSFKVRFLAWFTYSVAHFNLFYYSSIILDSFYVLLFPTLFWHNVQMSNSNEASGSGTSTLIVVA